MLAVERAGSLSGAARMLGVDHTTVSRHLSSLEQHLGAPLFERGPEGFVATPLGEETIVAAERMEEEVLGLLRRLDGASAELTGLVRLTTTEFLSAHLFAPALSTLLSEHPGLQVELLASSRQLDISRREADVAVRFSRPETPGLVTRLLGQVAFAWYASVEDPRPFEAQLFLGYDASSGHDTLQGYMSRLVPAEQFVMRSNSTTVLLEAIRAGLGCTALACFVGERDPALRRVPAPSALTPMPIWLAYHEDLRRSPRLRAVVTFIDTVIATHNSAFSPTGFPFDPE